MIEPIWIGEKKYAEAEALQEAACQEVAQGKALGRVLGLEHPLVVTLGVRGETGDVASDVAADYPVVRIRRGGQATLHNPGQLVIYPILNLRGLNLRPKAYVDLLVKTTRRILEEYGIQPDAETVPGVFINGAKIASIGVEIKRGVTKHGIALNVANDLEPFNHIVCCGVRGQKVTSLSQLGIQSTPEKVFSEWIRLFTEELKASPNLTPYLNPTTLDVSLPDCR